MIFTDILPLISSIFVFILGLIVFGKDKKARLNITFFLHSIAISVWLFSTFMMFINRGNPVVAEYWDRVVYMAVIFIPPFLYHFGLAYRGKKNNIILYIGYVLTGAFLFIIPTKYFVDGIFYYEWGIHTKAQLFHHLFLLYFVVYVVIWFIEIIKYYKKLTSPSKKERTKYILVGFLLLFGIGPIAYLPAYGISIYPFAYICGLIFTIFLTYAIIKHRLMNIQFVFRKSSVYLISLLVIVGIIEFSRLFYAYYFENFSLVVDITILVIAVSLYPKIKNIFYSIANKYFFTALYDSQEVIADISNKLRTTLDLKIIYDYIYEVVSSAFHVKKFCILKYNDVTDDFIIDYIRNIELMKGKHIVSNFEIKEFVSDQGIISMDEVKFQGLHKSKKIVSLLTQLEIDVVIPLKIKERVIGVIILGKKESGDIYTDEDLKLLDIIGTQSAMAVENAFLYRETVDFNVRLASEVEKATYDLREANKKLLKLDEAKSEFISIASHQLRTPLTVIKGYISMMLEGNFGSLTPQESISLKKVYESNERLIRLVENLLNISRIESGRLQFLYEEIQLEDLVQSVYDELTTHAKSKGLNFTLKMPKKKMPKVKIDEEKIRQVVMNLTDNSIKYTHKGSVTVTLKRVKEGIEFCVSDSGIGISKDDIPNLFKKFSRGTGTSLIHTEGTGLGLYVAKQMIVAHRGKVWVESKGEGRGAQFYFQLPVIK